MLSWTLWRTWITAISINFRLMKVKAAEMSMMLGECIRNLGFKQMKRWLRENMKKLNYMRKMRFLRGLRSCLSLRILKRRCR